MCAAILSYDKYGTLPLRVLPYAYRGRLGSGHGEGHKAGAGAGVVRHVGDGAILLNGHGYVASGVVEVLVVLEVGAQVVELDGLLRMQNTTCRKRKQVPKRRVSQHTYVCGSKGVRGETDTMKGVCEI